MPKRQRTKVETTHDLNRERERERQTERERCSYREREIAI
jgi:hypothetical protein